MVSFSSARLTDSSAVLHIRCLCVPTVEVSMLESTSSVVHIVLVYGSPDNTKCLLKMGVKEQM